MLDLCGKKSPNEGKATSLIREFYYSPRPTRYHENKTSLSICCFPGGFKKEKITVMLLLFNAGKITSLDTSTMRAAMKPGWEDLVRRCIQRFHAQHEGEISFAKRHHQEGLIFYF